MGCCCCCESVVVAAGMVSMICFASTWVKSSMPRMDASIAVVKPSGTALCGVFMLFNK